MTDAEKTEIINEVEERVMQKCKGYLVREDTATVLKKPREYWFGGEKKDCKMYQIFGAIIYWQAWEMIRKLTCLMCGRNYVRDLAGIEYADELCDEVCKAIYDIAVKYRNRGAE